MIAAVTAAAVVAWTSYVLLLGSDAGLSVPVVLTLVWAASRCWRCAESGGRCTCGTRAAVAGAGGCRAPRGTRARPCFAAAWTGAAFRVRFAWPARARRYVGAAGPAIRAGGFGSGGRVGLFRVREVEARSDGVVRLIATDACSAAAVWDSPGAPPPRVGEDSYRPSAAPGTSGCGVVGRGASVPPAGRALCCSPPACDSFEEYRRRVPRWLPRIARSDIP